LKLESFLEDSFRGVFRLKKSSIEIKLNNLK